MSGPLDPAGPVTGDRRVRRGRRRSDASAAGDIPAQGARAADRAQAGASVDPAPPAPTAPAPLLSAHLIGQAATAKRESPPSAQVVDKARSAYLGVEWSGPADRRTGRGRIAKTEV